MLRIRVGVVSSRYRFERKCKDRFGINKNNKAILIFYGHSRTQLSYICASTATAVVALLGLL